MPPPPPPPPPPPTPLGGIAAAAAAAKKPTAAQSAKPPPLKSNTSPPPPASKPPPPLSPKPLIPGSPKPPIPCPISQPPPPSQAPTTPIKESPSPPQLQPSPSPHQFKPIQSRAARSSLYRVKTPPPPISPPRLSSGLEEDEEADDLAPLPPPPLPRESGAATTRESTRFSALPPPPSPPVDYIEMIEELEEEPKRPASLRVEISAVTAKSCGTSFFPTDQTPTKSSSQRPLLKQQNSSIDHAVLTEKSKARPKKEFDVKKFLANPPTKRESALNDVDKLGRDITLKDKGFVTIDGGSVSVHYEANTDTDFADTDAFATGQAVFIEEAKRQAKLDSLLEAGYGHASMLYCWRSCSLAAPKRQISESEKQAYYCLLCDVLEPQIDKLRALLQFQKDAVKQFSDEIVRLTRTAGAFVSEAYLLSLGKMINLLSMLDELKNIKASMKNDFSAFKRASEITKRHTQPDQVVQSRDLSMFLANHNIIITTVKENLFPSKGKMHTTKNSAEIENLLCNIVSTCMDMYEKKRYMFPHEKHAMVKVVGFCLFLLDGESNINRMDGKKKLHLSKIDTIFKELEAVPLYGDMMIGPFQFVQRTPNYDSDKWTLCNSGRESAQAALLRHMPELRSEHMALVSELALCGKHARFFQDVTKARTWTEDDDVFYKLALLGLRTLSSWTSRITELFSWKMLHPANHETNRKCPEKAEAYEKAIKYNYSPEEKSALAEVIGMIKSVQQTMMEMQPQFQAHILSLVYCDIQQFVQVDIREQLRKLYKLKKPPPEVQVIISIMEGIRDIGADFADGVNPIADPIRQGVKDAKSGHQVVLRQRQVGPSSTQLYMLRTMLEGLLHRDRTSKKKHLESIFITQTEAFLKKSFFWHYVLNLSSSVRSCCDLSQLWFREFYIELTQGSRVQFSIDMSFPWILAKHILDTRDPRMMEYLLFPMDLYNDSGMWVVTHFKQQYMYEEIEAEVNLVFDQLTYTLSEQVYSYYKHLAGCVFLNKTYSSICKKKGINIPWPPRNRFSTLLRQCTVKILGRDIDIKKLVSQRLDTMFLHANKEAIRKFEGGDLCGVVELEGMITVNRLAHQMLSEHFEMADFDALLEEANEGVYCDKGRIGRITQHIILVMCEDALKHYCYNTTTNRYVTAALAFAPKREKGQKTMRTQLWGHEVLARCFDRIYASYSYFLGQPHFRAIVSLIDYQDIAVVITQLLDFMQNTITLTLKPYTEVFMNKGGFPEKCILPKYEYTSKGIMQYFIEQLKPIIQYGELQTMVFQGYREFGNAILFCLHLDQELACKEIAELKQATLFQGAIPRPYINTQGKEPEQIEKERKAEMEEKRRLFKQYILLPAVKAKGKQERIECTTEANILSRQKLCLELSIFQMVLTKMKEFLEKDRAVWERDEKAPPGCVMEVDRCRNFHRLWSAMQFMFCIPCSSTNIPVEQQFGDSINWGGLTIVALLGQFRRFELTDFCYHMAKVHASERTPPEPPKKGQTIAVMEDVKGMVARIRKIQNLNGNIFTVLNRYMHKPHEKYSHLYNGEIHHFDPPKPKVKDLADVELRRGGTLTNAQRNEIDSFDLIGEDFDAETADV